MRQTTKKKLQKMRLNAKSGLNSNQLVKMHSSINRLNCMLLFIRKTANAFSRGNIKTNCRKEEEELFSIVFFYLSDEDYDGRKKVSNNNQIDGSMRFRIVLFWWFAHIAIANIVMMTISNFFSFFDFCSIWKHSQL